VLAEYAYFNLTSRALDDADLIFFFNRTTHLLTYFSYVGVRLRKIDSNQRHLGSLIPTYNLHEGVWQYCCCFLVRV